MAVVRESFLSSNFQLLEVLVMGDQPKVVHKSSKSVFDTHTESKERKKYHFVRNTNQMNVMLISKIMPTGTIWGENLVCFTMYVPPTSLNARSLNTTMKRLLNALCLPRIDQLRLISAHWNFLQLCTMMTLLLC